MRQTKILLVLIVALIVGSQAEAMNEASFSSFKWSEDFEYEPVPDSLRDESAYFHSRVVEQRYVYEDGKAYIYELVYFKINVLSDNAIDEFNTFYLNDESVLEWVTIKARTINESGKVVNFDRKSIKEVVDEDNGEKYKIFAVEGLELGSMLEYYTVKKRLFSGTFGSVLLQRNHYVKNTSFSIVCPSNLAFELKPYNAYNGNYQEDSVDSLLYYKYSMSALPAVRKELFSNVNTTKAKVDYRLLKNSYIGKYELNTWDNAAANVYSTIYLISDKEQKRLNSYASDFLKMQDKLEAIKGFEQKVKQEILVKESAQGEYHDIAFAIDQSITSARGITKLFIHFLHLINVDCQLGLTCAREDAFFDPLFVNWNRLQDYLIYLPDYDEYITPSYVNLSLGNAYDGFEGQYGLFLEIIQVGDFESAIADVRLIEASESHENYDHIYSTLSIAEDMASVVLKSERAFKGHSGSFLPAYIRSLESDKVQVLLKDLSAMSDFNPDFSDIQIEESSAFKTAIDADFVFSFEAKIEGMLEYAGTSILLSIGKAIGPQSEVYQEFDRQNVIENNYNRSYYRELELNVPLGYRVENISDANILVYDIFEGDTVCAFESKAYIDKGKVKIVINEYYNRLILPKENYPQFRDVINAAANFNKLVFVLKQD